MSLIATALVSGITLASNQEIKTQQELGKIHRKEGIYRSGHDIYEQL